MADDDQDRQPHHPECRAHAARDVGVARQGGAGDGDAEGGADRAGHPLLEGEVTPERFAGTAGHLIVSRRGRQRGPVDDALAVLGLERRVVGSVGSYPASLFVLRDTDLIGLITEWGRPLADALGLVAFEIPLPLPTMPVGFAWHPRHDADPAHAWLRGCVRELLTPGPASG